MIADLQTDTWTDSDQDALDAADAACVADLGPGMTGAVHAAVMVHDVPAERRLRLDLMGGQHRFSGGGPSTVKALVALGYTSAVQVHAAEDALGLDIEALAQAGVAPDVAAALGRGSYRGRWRSMSAWQREGLAVATPADVEALEGLVGTDRYLGLAALPDPARRERVADFSAANATRISWIESGADLDRLQGVYDALGGGVDNVTRAVAMVRRGIEASDVKDFGIRFYESFGAEGIAWVRSSAMSTKVAKSLHSGLHRHGLDGLAYYARLAVAGLTRGADARAWTKVLDTTDAERIIAAHRTGITPAYVAAVIAMMGRSFRLTEVDLASVTVLAGAYPDPDGLRDFARKVCSGSFAYAHYLRRDGDPSVVLAYLAALVAHVGDESRRVAVSRSGIALDRVEQAAGLDDDALWAAGASHRTEYETWRCGVSSRWGTATESTAWPYTVSTWLD